MSKIETKVVSRELWSEVEKLFGQNGACGGCWCMSWRTERNEKWDDIKGEFAKQRFKKGILNHKIFGVLAYIDDEPVGWCTFGPRTDFPKLNRAPSFKCDDADAVWSVPCFFVSSKFREIGVASAMLETALAAMRGMGARIAEGYPSKPNETGRYISSFSWTGTQSLFKKEGFKIAGNRDGGKQRVRKSLK